MTNEKEAPKVEEKQTPVVEKKEVKKVTVVQVIKALGTNVTTKENKSGWTTIRTHKNICYIKDSKYGVSMWNIKQNKTIKVETPADIKEFADAVKKSVKKD